MDGTQTELFSTLLVALKFAGIALSGVFGSLALFTTVRNPATGRSTLWGRIALIGVLASTIVAGGAQGVEIYVSNQQQVRQEALVLQQLHEIRRAMEPLDAVEFTYTVEMSLEEDLFHDLRQRFDAAAAALSAQQPKREGACSEFRTVRSPAVDSDNELEQQQLCIASVDATYGQGFLLKNNCLISGLFGDEATVTRLLCNFPGFEFSAYAGGKTLAEGDLPTTPDLFIPASGNQLVDSFVYFPRSHMARFVVIQNPPTGAEYWRNNGVSSILDLNEALVALKFLLPKTEKPLDEDVAQRISDSYSLVELNVHFSRGRTLQISRDVMKHTQAKNGSPLIVFRFPPDVLAPPKTLELPAPQ